MTVSNLLWRTLSFVVAAAFVALWQLIANLKLVSPVFLPGPDRAWAALMRGISSGDLVVKLLGTVEHMALGWLAASIAGIGLGALIVAVTVEITINPIGLGAGIMTAQQALRPDLMLAYLVWIGIVGYALNSGLMLAQRHLFGRAALMGEPA